MVYLACQSYVLRTPLRIFGTVSEAIRTRSQDMAAITSMSNSFQRAPCFAPSRDFGDHRLGVSLTPTAHYMKLHIRD